MLVVDDCNFTRRVSVRILECFGARNVREALDGDDAIDQVIAKKPDIVLTDWVMSPRSGLHFTHWARTGRDTPDPYLPIIMMSSYSDLDRVKEARDAGVNEFLVKPMAPVDLMRRIQSIIEKPRPFVRNDNYFGPDRRRRMMPFDGEDRRFDHNAILLRGAHKNSHGKSASISFE
jgi:PleD family two-component response regulator